MGKREEHIVWVRRVSAADMPDATLRARAGVDDESVDVERIVLGKWASTTIPEGSHDEHGSPVPLLSIGFQVLPPEGRVYLIGPTSQVAD